MKEPMMLTLCLGEDSILVSRVILDALNSPKQVQVLINEERQTLLLQPCGVYDREARVVQEPPLVVSYFAGEGFTADELRARLTGGARVIPASTGTRPVGPLVDAYGAFQVRGDDKTPPPVKEYTLSPSGHNLKLDFTASDATG